MEMNLATLSSSIAHLENALKHSRSAKMLGDKGKMWLMKNTVVQFSEYVFELSWPLIRKCLQSEFPESEKIGELDDESILKLAHQKKLVEKPDIWLSWSHKLLGNRKSFKPENIDDIFQSAGNYLIQAHYLFALLEKKLGNGNPAS